MDRMTIGKVAAKAGVGIQTVRFYERKGLIERPAQAGGSGFRVYPITAVKRIKFVRQAQELGFSLGEVRELLDLRADPSADARQIYACTEAKLSAVKDKIRKLHQVRRALQTMIAACPRKGPLQRCSILDALDEGAS